MGRIYANLSMSLDGFIAGPNVRVGNGMGDGGDDLHDWIFTGKSEVEIQAFMAEQFASVGAVLMGRTMLDVGIGPWGDEPAFHAPVFVVTHRPAEPIEKAGGTTYTFVTDGTDAALRLAREAAGGQDLRIEGGAAIIRQYLHAGVLDELRLHVVPILLGDGVRLFTAAEDRAVELAATGTVGETSAGSDRPRRLNPATEVDLVVRTLRALLAVEAASLLAAAALHAGVVIGGPFDQAATYEASLGLILALALGVTFLGPAAARVVGLAAQALTLAGASIGLYLALRGIAPNTPLDIVYHVVLMGLLVGGLVVAWRIRRGQQLP